MTDDTAKAILRIKGERSFASGGGITFVPDLPLTDFCVKCGNHGQGHGPHSDQVQCHFESFKDVLTVADARTLARLWLLLPEIRTFANGVYPVPDKLLAKLSDESLQGEI